MSFEESLEADNGGVRGKAQAQKYRQPLEQQLPRSGEIELRAFLVRVRSNRQWLSSRAVLDLLWLFLVQACGLCSDYGSCGESKNEEHK